MHSMKHLKRTFLMSTVFVAMALVVAACGGSGSTGSNNSGSSGSSRGTYGYGGSGSTAPTAKATSGSSSGSSAMIKTAAATVKGQSVTLLTDAQGRTLYYFTAD